MNYSTTDYSDKNLQNPIDERFQIPLNALSTFWKFKIILKEINKTQIRMASGEHESHYQR